MAEQAGPADLPVGNAANGPSRAWALRPAADRLPDGAAARFTVDLLEWVAISSEDPRWEPLPGALTPRP